MWYNKHKCLLSLSVAKYKQACAWLLLCGITAAGGCYHLRSSNTNKFVFSSSLMWYNRLKEPVIVERRQIQASLCLAPALWYNNHRQYLNLDFMLDYKGVSMKAKRILAFLGVIFLVSLYVLTLVASLTASPNAGEYFLASIYATIVIPVLFWAYHLIYKLVKKKDN